jgi:hypothetical protein
MTDTIESNEFRQWIHEFTRSKSIVREEAIRTSLSALLHRLNKFGDEWLIETLSARELLRLVLFTTNKAAHLFLSAAFTRAIIAEDQDFIEGLSKFSIIEEQKAWLNRHSNLSHKSAQKLIDTHEQNIDEESQAVGRILIARQYPRFGMESWINDAKNTPRIIQHHLIKSIIRSDLVRTDNIVSHLLKNPRTLTIEDPDDVISLMILNSDKHPTELLERFTGYCGEKSITASAEWLLENNQPQQAIGAAKQIRFLSQHWDRAQMILGIAHTELKDADETKGILSRLEIGPEWRQVALAFTKLNESDPNDLLINIASTCTPTEPEVFFSSIEKLVRNSKITESRYVLADKLESFSTHQPIQELAKALGVKA